MEEFLENYYNNPKSLKIMEITEQLHQYCYPFPDLYERLVNEIIQKEKMDLEASKINKQNNYQKLSDTLKAKIFPSHSNIRNSHKK
jgi:hypothetical protein